MSQRLRINRLGDIVGADSGNQDENDEDKDDDDLDGDQDDLDDDENDDDDGDEDEDDVETLKEKLAKAEQERERAHRRMRRADRAKSRADNELKALREGTQKDLAAAQDRVKELEAELAKKSGTDTTSRIKDSFRDLEDVKWHNPSVAFALLDLDEIDVDDDGKVDVASLKDAVQTLAKEHPYLVKKAATKDDEDDDEDKKPRTPSGQRSSGSRKTRQEKRTATLRSRYGIPAGSRL